MISLVATVILGGIALLIAFKYQRQNAADSRTKHNELIENLASVATLLGANAAEQIADTIVQAHTISSKSQIPSRAKAQNVWRTGAVVAADVTGDGRLDLVTQHRGPTQTVLRLFRVDDQFRPALIGQLNVNEDRRFAVGPGRAALLATESEEGKPSGYTWDGSAFTRADPKMVADVPSELTRWPDSP